MSTFKKSWNIRNISTCGVLNFIKFRQSVGQHFIANIIPLNKICTNILIRTSNSHSTQKVKSLKLYYLYENQCQFKIMRLIKISDS